jgi:hypothetical protein
MKSFKEHVEGVPLEEAYFGDYYPKGFMEFYNKYKKLKDRGDLWVQFTSFQGDVLDKTAYEKPDHSDPVGIYCYPIKYVIDHPADIWYGHGSRYVRVLQHTGGNDLRLHLMDIYDARNILYRMGLSSAYMDMAAKAYPDKNKGVNKIGKLFFAAVQIDWDKSIIPKKHQYNLTKNIITRSGKEQTALFRKAGYDVIIDGSKNHKQAIINDREPEQIVFLNRRGFKVLEVFETGDKDSRTRTTADMDAYRDKVAGMIVGNILKDSIVDVETTSLNGWKYYFTAKGRLLKVIVNDTSIAHRMKTMAFGERPYKAFKKNDPHDVDIVLESEKVKFEFGMWSDDKLSDAMRKFAFEWNNLADNPDAKFWTLKGWKGENDNVNNKLMLSRIQKDEDEWVQWFNNKGWRIFNEILVGGGYAPMKIRLTDVEKYKFIDLSSSILKGVDYFTLSHLNSFDQNPKLHPYLYNIWKIYNKYGNGVDNWYKNTPERLLQLITHND